MKKTLFLCAALFSTLILFSQRYSINWGEELKIRKGTTDLDIVTADNTGLYFTEARLLTTYFIIGSSIGNSHKLYKVDKNFGEVFDKDYRRELKGLEFHSFQALGNDLYIFATDYIKKERAFKVYGAKVDKNFGELVGDFAELGSYDLESKKDDYEMKMTPIRNGSAFLMVSNISNKDRVSIAVTVLDKNFVKKENAIINLSFDPGHYTLQDVKLTPENKIVLLGKEFGEAQTGKRKKLRLVFKQYAMSIYTNKGVKEKDIIMESGDRFIINGKIIDQPTGGLLLAGFYSNTAKKENLNGFFINKIDVQKGEITTSSFKEINAGMLGKNFVDVSDEDDESKEEKKRDKKAKDEDEDEMPNEFLIRNVNINPADNSIVITSEVSQYSFYTYTSSSYNNMTKTWSTTRTYVHMFTTSDILVINADKDGGIKWINAIPKSQREVLNTSDTRNGTGVYFSSDWGSYFAHGGGMPYYSSHISLLNNNKLIILMNDHTSNNVNAEYGNKVKMVYNFRKKSNAYGVSIDLATGKMTRQFIYSNNDETILMPRHALVVNNEVYLPSWRTHMMAKTKLKFAKILVK